MTSQSQESPKVFFILGGPGSGKGTVCAKLATDYGYSHYSAGDLLREAASSGTSATAELIASTIRAGNIVPSDITVRLIKEVMKANPNPRGYILDGFPRKFDQASMFEESIAKAKAVLYIDCTEQAMAERVRARAHASESEVRTDDNDETLRKRLRVNMQECVPVVEAYKKQNRCYVVDGNQTREKVYCDVRQVMSSLGETPL